MTIVARTSPPAPVTDIDSRFYWDGLRSRRLLLQLCSDCEHHRFPPIPSCPYCGSPRVAVREASGEGTVYSFIVVVQSFTPELASDVPYPIATVSLDEGPRMLARVEGGRPAIGDRVHAVYLDHGDWTEIRFERAVMDRRSR
jgi:uncharacterized OB-fold protein